MGALELNLLNLPEQLSGADGDHAEVVAPEVERPAQSEAEALGTPLAHRENVLRKTAGTRANVTKVQ